MRRLFAWKSHRATSRGQFAVPLRAETGSTLIEVLVSAILVALIAAAVAQALISNSRLSGEQHVRSVSDELAQQDQERLKGMSAQQLTGLNQTRTVTLDGTTYTVNSAANFLNSAGGTSCGSSGSGAAAYYRIVSTVTNWAAGANGRPAVVEESVITPPAGGVLLTQVVDQTGTALSGVSVSASGADVASGTTDANGCVTFAGLTAGSYTVSVTSPGYVDTTGDTSPISRSATVTSTGTSTPSGNPIKIGQAASFTANFTTGLSGAGGEGDAAGWYGAGSSDTMSSALFSTALSSPATSVSGSGLFPFAFTGPSYNGNYQIWGGRCVQQRPPTGTDMFNITPGSNQTISVQEPPLGVTSVKYAGVTVKPAHIRLWFVSSSGTSCFYGYSPTIVSGSTMPATGWLANPGQPFATNGTPASASGQTGNYWVCADYNPGSGYKNTFVTGVTNTSFTSLNVVPSILITSSSSSGQCA
jgi:Tfp pilus assembly protein PilX